MSTTRKCRQTLSSTLVGATVVLTLALSALGARHPHQTSRGSAEATPLAESGDYLAWHRQEAARVDIDALGGSLRLFSTIADKIAADATESTATLARETDR